MNLTTEQLQSVKDGLAVRVEDHEHGLEFVVIRADVFQRVQSVLGDADPREMYPLVDRTMSEEDEGDPLLDSYQRYRP